MALCHLCPRHFSYPLMVQEEEMAAEVLVAVAAVPVAHSEVSLS